MTLYYKGFGDDVADSHPRVEGAHRVLEDELEVLAKEMQAAFGEAGDVGAFDNYLTGRGAVESGNDPQQGGLATTGFSNDAEAFPLLYFEADAAESANRWRRAKERRTRAGVVAHEVGHSDDGISH